MNLFQALTRRRQSERSFTNLPLSLTTWGQQLPWGTTQTLINNREEIGADFRGYVDGIYKNNGVVFACMAARSLLFSEARFQWRQLRSGTPGDLFGTAELTVLESPWPNGTTGDLLARAIQDVDLAGNFYAVRQGDQLKRLHPDWITIILGSRRADWQPGDLDTELAGYLYHPGGIAGGRKPVPLLPDAVAHWAPTKDPAAAYRGMSWLTPIVREVLGDVAAMEHKLKFFEQGATPNLFINLPAEVQSRQFREWADLFRAEYEGTDAAYKSMMLGGGADAKVVGADFKQIDFKTTQGHGETRICAAARVMPIIAGVSEGLEASTYSNYAQARRAFGDMTLRPLWRTFCGALQTVMTVPPGSQLFYDDRDIPFLQEDQTDAAAVQQTNMATIAAAIASGFDPSAAVGAVMAGDLRRLASNHSGLVSVQLQKPGSQNDTPTLPAPATNGANGRRDLLEELGPLLLPPGS
jgi:hypothetical protein